jgi:predicted CoA-binding protein
MPATFDLARYQDALTIQRVIHTAKTVAIIGLSPNELRASYFVGYYLMRHGFTVIPVNPRESEILGTKCYASLADVPVKSTSSTCFARRMRCRALRPRPWQSALAPCGVSTP